MGGGGETTILLKVAIKREQSQACLNFAEREQVQGRMPLMWQSGKVALWHFSVLHFQFMPMLAISFLYPTVATPAGDDVSQS